jgi:hypothetical protein
MKQSFISLALIAVALCGCTGPVIIGSGAAAIVLSRPDSGGPADTKDQIPEHESWCYQTMADSQCFAHPQDVPPGRLINVDPPSRYPVDLSAYHQALIGTPPAAAAATAAPVPLPPPDVESEKRNLHDEISTAPLSGANP